MKAIFKPALAGIALAAGIAPLASAPAAAQVVQGIGVVNLPAVIANANAYKTAQQQQQTTYKAQIDQANARRAAIQAQLQPLVQQLQTASQAENPNQQALQQQAAQIQQIQSAGQREIQQLLQPVALSQAYVEEQLNDQLAAAVESAAKARNVTFVVGPDSVLYADNAYNLNQAVLDALNTQLPSVQIVPPQGWLPRELREQQAAAQQQAPAQQAAPVQGR